LLPSGLVVPVDLRLAQRQVVIAAGQDRPQLSLQTGVGDLQQGPDRRSDQRDRVHRGDRVVERRGVQDPLHPNQARLRCRVQHHPEQPARISRRCQPGPHVDQHGVGEADPAVTVIATDAAGVTPPVVEAVPLDGFAVAQALQPLQDHHHRDHRRRNAAPTPVTEQIGEHLIREQPVTLAMEHRIHRRFREQLPADPAHLIEQITLTFRLAQRHDPSPGRSPHQQGHSPEPTLKTGDRHATKDTSHLSAPLMRHRTGKTRSAPSRRSLHASIDVLPRVARRWTSRAACHGVTAGLQGGDDGGGRVALAGRAGRPSGPSAYWSGG